MACWAAHWGEYHDEVWGTRVTDPKVLFAPLPVLWITGCLATASKGDKNVYYDCPVYKAPRRTGLNFIASVLLRTEDTPTKWTLRGVALLATID